MDQTNEPEVTVDLEATEAEAEEQVEDTDDPAVLKARIKKLEEKAIAQRERAKLLKKEVKEATKKEGLDNADYALLMASGIKEDDEIELVEKYMKKWDIPLRQVLKDADIQEKLKGMRLERDVKNAMPSATKRGSSGQIDNLDYWVTKYETTGELPDNFELRSAVINTKASRYSATTPPWHRK